MFAGGKSALNKRQFMAGIAMKIASPHVFFCSNRPKIDNDAHDFANCFWQYLNQQQPTDRISWAVTITGKPWQIQAGQREAGSYSDLIHF